MAKARQQTKLPLDRFASILGLHPLHFNQVYLDLSGLPVTNQRFCDNSWLQYAWQNNDAVGREDLATALAEAEAKIEQYLGHSLIPTWEVDEWQPTVRPWRPELINLSVSDIRGYAQTAEVAKKHVVSGGIQAKTLIVADSPITYSDEDGDGYEETATLTVPGVTFTAPCELAVYAPVSDGVVPSGGLDEWEIRPISATIDTNTDIATIRLRREQLVLPSLLEAVITTGVEGSNNANFLEEVDVYRKYNDPQRQVQFLWEPFAYGCATCNGNGCPTCSYSTQEGCFSLRDDPRHGLIAFHPATWDADDLDFTPAAWALQRQPDLVRVWYYAGYRDKRKACPMLEMDDDLAYTVSIYAATLLDRPICGCNNVVEFIEKWREDLAKISDRAKYQITQDDLANPLGTTRGAVFAWKRVSRYVEQNVAAYA